MTELCAAVSDATECARQYDGGVVSWLVGCGLNSERAHNPKVSACVLTEAHEGARNANLPSSCRHAGTNWELSEAECLNCNDLREWKSWRNACSLPAAIWIQWPSLSGWQ